MLIVDAELIKLGHLFLNLVLLSLVRSLLDHLVVVIKPVISDRLGVLRLGLGLDV